MNDYINYFTWDMLHEASQKNGMQVFNPMIRYYRDIIKNGLPNSVNINGEKPPTVCVIGGGMSGLVSAELLSNAGYDVTILEASPRIGGRIHTVTFPDKDSSEAGAMRLLEDYQLVFDYIDKLGLSKHEFINHDPKKQDWVFVNGVKVRQEEYQNNPDCLGFDTIGTERGKTADELWNEALSPIFDMVDQSKGLDTIENWQKVIERYGHHSVYTYLAEEVKYSQGAIDMIVVMLFLEARMHLSLLQQVVEAVDHRPDAKYYGIDGGSSKLPEALLKAITKASAKTKSNRIPVKVKFRAFVQSMTQNKAQDQVTVSWYKNNADDIPVKFKGNDQIIYPDKYEVESETFDYAIVTCTPPAIRRFKFTPSLPMDKQKALRELNLNASTKIFLQFKEQFWYEEGFKHGSSVTDLPSRAVYYPSTDDSKVVISSYTWAQAARGWDSLTPQQRVEESLNDLVALHGEHIRDLFVCGQSYSWLLDDYSMGEAAMIFPEQLSLQAILARPVGNIYFAGDTLSFKVAWIEGAIESGMRAVLELVGLPPVPSIGILDCTLRDGGYMNDWSFTREQAKELAGKSAAAGAEIIEIGYRNGPSKNDKHAGESGISTNDYIKDLRAVIPCTTKVSVMFHDYLVSEDDFTQMKDLGVDLVRCTLPPDKNAAKDLENSYRLLDYAQSIGLETGANITFSTEYTLDDLLNMVKMGLEHNVTYLYIADSNGSMTPATVKKVFSYLKQHVDLSGVRIGFHNHNMMGLAVSNALAAVEQGVSLVDATYRGMGRSSGNVPLESFSGTLNLGGYPRSTMDQLKALHVAQYLEDQIPDSVPVPTVVETAFGIYNFNQLESSYFTNASVTYDVDILDLLAFANSQNVDRRLLDQQMVNDLAMQMKEGNQVHNQKM